MPHVGGGVSIMFELLIIAAAFLLMYRHLQAFEPTTAPATAIAPRKASKRVQQLSDYADRLYSEKKWNAAEKAYLQVLKVDHKNVTSYSHLGIIYSTQKNMADAIECFAIAARLRPSAVTFQNLGLGYFDNKNYVKSIAAFEKAIMFEPSVHRYIGLSKAHAKLANTNASIEALEKAAGLDPKGKVVLQLADAYETAGRHEEAVATREKLQEPTQDEEAIAPTEA